MAEAKDQQRVRDEQRQARELFDMEQQLDIPSWLRFHSLDVGTARPAKPSQHEYGSKGICDCGSLESQDNYPECPGHVGAASPSVPAQVASHEPLSRFA